MKILIPCFYMEYGRYINKFRAMPYMIDGLKPVERRVLLVINNVASSKFTKSAKIVGDCIGTIHPHGDCLNADTLVYLLNGTTKTIKDLYYENKDQWVLSYDNINNIIVPSKAHSFRIGQNTSEYYKITFSNGESIECTENHQFLNKTRNWIKTKNLSINDELDSQQIYNNSYNYPRLLSNYNSEEIHQLVGNFKYNNKNKDQVFHHSDENKFNNVPNNIILENRSSHAKLHNNETNINGLKKGLESMYGNSNPLLKEEIKEKNKRLRSIINKNMFLIKATKAINLLIERGLELTIDNYESLKNEIYNLTKISKLNEKGYSFKQLCDIAPTFRLDTSSTKGLTTTNKKSKKVDNECINLTNQFKCISNIIRNMLKYNSIEKLNWEDYITESTRYIIGTNQDRVKCYDIAYLKDKFNINTVQELIKKIPLRYLCIITNIEKIKIETSIPFYDFTVDNYQNMLICTGKDKDNNYNLITAHNSSVYSTICNTINSNGFIETQGNFGSVGMIDDDPPAAYRYTELKLNSWVKEMAFKYINYVPWETLEFEPEPLALPSPIPIGLIGTDINFGISFSKMIMPKFTVRDLAKRLEWLLKNKRPTYKENLNEYKESEFGPLIKPNLRNCHQEEVKVGDFYKLLITGKASIKSIPYGNIGKKHIDILGIVPGTKNKRLLNATDKKTCGKPEDFLNIHLVDLCGDEKEPWKYHIMVEPKGSQDLNNLAGKIWNDYLIRNINYNCLFYDNNGNLLELGIDDILLNNYDFWKMARLNKRIKDIEKIINLKYEAYALKEIIKKFILNNSIKSIDDIISLYKKHIKENNKNKNLFIELETYDSQKNKWIKNKYEYTETDLRNIISKKTVKQLIEIDIDLNSIEQDYQLKKNKILSIDQDCLNTVLEYTK